jgi:hypothetical protein
MHGKYEDLLTDLIYLRKDTGFKETRIYKKANVFFEVIGGKEQTFETVKIRLLSAIDAISDRQSAEALLAAFGLLSGYENIPSLKGRREKYGTQVGRKYDTVMDRENAAIEELVLGLLTARYAAAPLPSAVPTLHNAAVHERAEITTLVRDRLWKETREFYRLIPLMDGAEYLEVSSDIPARVKPTSECVAETETTGGGLRHRFFYKEPLRRGHPIDFGFIMFPDGTRDETLILIEETRAFHEPTLSCRFEVMFLGEKPKIVWQYRQLPYYERPGKPTKQHLLDIENTSTVRAEFNDLYGGLFSGVAWDW